MEALGHRVVRVQEDELAWPSLPGLVEREGGQCLFWQRTWPVPYDEAMAALAQVRTTGVPSVSYHLDLFLGLDREHQVRDTPFFQGTDLLVTPDDSPRWEEFGVTHFWQPPGVYGAECKIGHPLPNRYPHEVVFVGSHPYPHAEWEPIRSALIARLQQRYGRRFGLWPRRGRPIRGQELADLYATAKVVVGDSCLVGPPVRFWSDRTPETLGRRGFLLHPEVPGMEEWYTDGEHLRTYPVGDLDRVCELVDHYLAHDDECERIRDVGQALVLSRDTYEHRMATVLAEVERRFGFPAARPLSPPSPQKVVSARHGQHRGSFVLAEGESDAIAVREVWETNDYRVTQAAVRGKVVVDLGGNCGAFAVLAAKLGAKVVLTYEPHPTNCAALRRNLTTNGVAHQVRSFQVAVGPTTGMAWLSGDGGGATVVGQSGGVEVRVLAVDDVLRAALALAPVAMVKIDVEGAEYGIIEAADPDLLVQVETISMEAHGPRMPHLAFLNDDGRHVERWLAMVAKLAALGRIEMLCRPMWGGMIWWHRF